MNKILLPGLLLGASLQASSLFLSDSDINTVSITADATDTLSHYLNYRFQLSPKLFAVVVRQCSSILKLIFFHFTVFNIEILTQIYVIYCNSGVAG